MKTVIIIFLNILLFCNGIFSQQITDTITIIKLPEYYKGHGIIFSDKYIPPVKKIQSSKRFNPIKEEIQQAEKILITNYNKSLRNNPHRCYNCTPTKNVKKKFKYWNRQYLGYVDANGHRIIWIKLLKFRSKRKEKKYFANWKNGFVFGFGDFYEKNTDSFSVNITLGTLSW